ncbi:MAG: 50S ribosomal protein L16 [Candidatus Nanopelagicaceae bacterium]|jgi:large subunit ribosomal protein L16|nr:50S ribosomal protein L16 [Candidatus Nanopelagicaceae bacterium]
MLIPRRVKHRKQHRPDRFGKSKGGTAVAFGDFGLQATEGGYVTNRQIEAARIAMTRHIKRGGKVWINIYPDRPLTKKPAETRMGSGKGSPEFWIANVKPGRVMFEISGVTLDVAKQALSRAAHKLPVKSRVVLREEA